MREMSLADGVGAREKALEKLLPAAPRGDFIGILSRDGRLSGNHPLLKSTTGTNFLSCRNRYLLASWPN